MDELAAREIASLLHNLNNELQVVLGRTEMALSATPVETRKHLERVLKAIRRGSKLGQEAQSLAKRLATRREHVELNDILTNAVEDCEDFLVPEITLKIEVANEKLYTRLNSELLTQAIRNLVKNAREAMPGSKGTITLRAALQDEERLVCIQVSDDGAGMTESVRDHCLEEFYTTKDGVGGTGLGLFTVKRFVDEHRGRVRVESEIGKGTMIEMCFPRVLEPA